MRALTYHDAEQHARGWPQKHCCTYLADPSYDEPNVLMRMKHLGDHQPAGTVVGARLLEARWKLEIEVVAAT